MELPFSKFDLTLGMDWLVGHQLSLDCILKRVTLITSIGKEIVLVVERRDYQFNVISALVAEKLVRKGSEAYLIYILDTTASKSTMQNISTVMDFFDVFPEE